MSKENLELWIPLLVQTTTKLYDVVQAARKERFSKKLNNETLHALEKLSHDINDIKAGIITREINILKSQTIAKLANDAINDFEYDDELKTKLLNAEIQAIINTDGYKYMYPKLTKKDLTLLQILGNGFRLLPLKAILQQDAFKNGINIIWAPTYALLDINNIAFDGAKEHKKINGSLMIASENYFNIFQFIGTLTDEVKVITSYNNYKEQIFNLINLGLLIYSDNYELLTVITKEPFNDIHPFALAITSKGSNLYQMINNH